MWLPAIDDVRRRHTLKACVTVEGIGVVGRLFTSVQCWCWLRAERLATTCARAFARHDFGVLDAPWRKPCSL